MIWYAVIGVSFIVGYLTGFHLVQRLMTMQYERILKAQAQQAENATSILRSTNSELRAQIEILCEAKKVVKAMNEVQP